MFVVLELPVQGVYEMDGGSANLFLEAGIDDLDAAVMLFRQVLGLFFGVGVTAKIAPASGGVAGSNANTKKRFSAINPSQACASAARDCTRVASTKYPVPSTVKE